MSDDLRDDLHDAIAATLNRHERSMLTRWVLIAESVEDDGTRGLWLKTDESSKPWDVLGLLDFATVSQQAAIIHSDDES